MHNQLMSPQGPHFCAHKISGSMASIGISDVVTASVYSVLVGGAVHVNPT